MIDRFAKSINLGEISRQFEEIYNSALAEYAERGVFFLDKNYIINLNESTRAFPNISDDILADAERVSADSEYALYALFVCRAMEHRDLFLENLKYFLFPEDKYLFLSLLCLLSAITNMRSALTARGVPEDIIDATVLQFEDCAFLYAKRFGRLGYSKRYFDHMQLYVDVGILNIGRLRFESRIFDDPIYLLENNSTAEQVAVLADGEFNEVGLYSDTPPIQDCATYRASFAIQDGRYIANPVSAKGRCEPTLLSFDASEWTVRLSPGDSCLAVHIPDKGALTVEACAESYSRALEVFGKCYPEMNIKAFRCHSWMLAPELEELTKPGSNIVAFAEKYHRFPIHTDGQDVMNFVFYLKTDKYEDLPEDTSLQRALKARYLAGEYLYEYGGIFTIDRI